ncbi:MAG: UDP-N-acetyl glucosamine 2-epimerase [Prevotella sp.]|nr:UDP-N-acetyl glucosamine 2-epimerase [Prevotella sp.]
MNVCIVAGARPNFIKVAPIMWAIQKAKEQGRDIDCRLVYAGRDDDPTLEPSLFADLEIRRPDVFLGVDCENLNELTGQVMSAFERYLQANKTDVVIVVDDLASTMAAAIVTKKQGILLAHLVAGTRSFDINMPKEINRLVIDGLSDLLFTAGMGSQSTAAREGSQEKVYMVGNILMDTLRHNRNKLVTPQSASLPSSPYLVFTLNRKALLADEENMKKMLEAIVKSANGMTIYAPLRNKAKALVSASFPSEGPTAPFTFLPPLSYLEFGWLTAHAQGIITDSGNVAEEATFNGVPCITLNSYTEHIETVKVGTNVLVGEDAEVLGTYVDKMVRGEWKPSAIPERWDGRSAERIVQILLDRR